MRNNGTLQYEIAGEVELNDFGEVVSATESGWSDPVPCNIATVSDTRLGAYEDGEFRQASFLILVELALFTNQREGVPCDRVRLRRLGEDLGEHRVMSIEPLTTVGRVKIVV